MKIKFIYITLLSCIALNVSAQKAGVKKADKNYDKFAYIDAIKTYERVAEKGFKTPDMLQKIGNAYYYNADLVNAEKWYSELFAMTEEVEPEYFFRYAQSLKGVGNYAKADEMMAKFNLKSGNDSRGLIAKTKKDYREEIKKNSGRYKIEDAGINSEYSDYGTAFYLDKVIFTSTRDTGNFSKRKHSWTDQYFSNLYSADMTTEGVLSSAGKYGKKLNTKFHESTPAYTKDGKTVYFTRNNFLDGKKGKDANKVTLLKIYKATLEEDKWINITALPFNSDSYQVAHPTLSADEKTLYFASDMPGTKGLSDLYKVDIKEDGSFGTPVNLGSDINTEGRETFPFITSDNELYFASDGHPGLGGLDIFITKLEKDGSFKQVHNVGESANSQYDDFALIINKTSKRGFLTSNRPGVGNDDIYKFLETREIDWDCEQSLVGIVTDANTDAILPNTKLTLFDEKFTKLRDTISGLDGRYDFGIIDCEKKYYVRAEKETYTTKEVPVIIAKESGITELPIELDSAVKAIPVGGDLADVFGINLIYFDLDKWNIRPDAAIDIAKILDVLNQYPTMKIDIRSHTDSRQTHKYNEVLSERRAKSTRDWLIKHGIAAERLTAKGYGETQLVNKCADNVECSEAEHQLNRRSQFIITDL
ncbi:OmpA family protein [Flavobacterium sp.]|jgi:outer membrane protein OmpA-like peptidoglycan-associated protein/tetratricopeptide (TPR) repeat protein|uniref:OmpA family protein n=1 Tax=Flavobacterium sp. TaxID=239 RepID=UPI0037C008AA